MFKLTTIAFALLISVSQISGQNLLTNGDFENDFTSWQNLIGGGGTASFSIDNDAHSGTKSMKAFIEQTGANDWDVQSINTSNWQAEIGKIYEISFWAKSESNSTLRMIQQNNSYTSKEFSTTPEWQLYSWNYTAKEASPQLKFHYAYSGTFYIDDIQVNAQSARNDTLELTVSPSIQLQEMVGFGGALTWFCDRITSSPHKNEIMDLYFNDLGADILRLKNWYYPSNYPTDKSPSTMEVSWFKPHFDATIELYNLTKSINPSVEVLLSSWGPPSYLKSNGELNGGTLKKNNGEYMYAEFAQYWEDLLNNLGFSPDWLSLQNEPGYLADWETCEWRPSETSNFPGLDQAFDVVYDKVKNRTNLPKFIGPESENIGSAGWDNSLNTFREFAKPMQERDYIYAYAYHVYNFYNESTIEDHKHLYNIIRDEFNDKPNIMSEFSKGSFDWLQTSSVIQNALIEANASGYVYWSMMWDENNSSAMLAIDNNGEYTVQYSYYVMKHFAKFIDEGDVRIALTGADNDIKATAFLKEDNSGITVILSNTSSSDKKILLDLPNASIIANEAYQSTDENYYQSVSFDPTETNTLPSRSLTTLSITFDQLITSSEKNLLTNRFHVFPNPAQSTVYIEGLSPSETWKIFNTQGLKVLSGIGAEIKVGELPTGYYILQSESGRAEFSIR